MERFPQNMVRYHNFDASNSNNLQSNTIKEYYLESHSSAGWRRATDIV
jgi:hypothetical protein